MTLFCVIGSDRWTWLLHIQENINNTTSKAEWISFVRMEKRVLVAVVVVIVQARVLELS